MLVLAPLCSWGVMLNLGWLAIGYLLGAWQLYWRSAGISGAVPVGSCPSPAQVAVGYLWGAWRLYWPSAGISAAMPVGELSFTSPGKLSGNLGG